MLTSSSRSDREQHPPARPRAGFFSELIYKVETENPKQFALPNDLKLLQAW
jgi:hypothetical protein